MKRIIYYLIFAISIFTQSDSFAMHLIGGQMTYQSVPNNPNQYLITYKMYRDCSGISFCNCAPGPLSSSCTVSLSITGAQTPCSGVSYGSVTLPIVTAGSGYDIIQLCNTSKTICSNCGTRTPGSFTPGIEVYLFQGIVNLSALPSSCCLVNIGFSDCCRNNANTILANPTSLNYYVGITINRCLTNPNNSANFNNEPEFVVRQGYDQIIDLSATDPDGDSLSYHFSPSKTGPTSAAPYLAPYSPNLPFPYLGIPGQSPPLLPPFGIQLNSVTGQLRFRSINNWVSNLAIEVKEWRRINGVMTYIGSVIRDHQFYCVTTNANNSPNIKTFNSAGTIYDPNYQITDNTCPGANICRTFVATDLDPTDTTDLTISSNAYSLSNFSFTRLYDSATRAINGPLFDSVRICWTPSTTHSSNNPYIFTLTATDRKCSIKGKSTLSYSIYVGSVPQAKINKKVTGLLSRKFTYSKTNSTPNNPNSTVWQIESIPGSNNYTNIIGDSIEYNFPQIGFYRIRLGLNSSCNTSWILDSLAIGGFNIMSVNEKGINCRGISTGFIKLAALGGTAPYQFKLNNGTYTAVDSFSNLAAGNYWAYARDANNLRDSILITLYQPANAIALSIIEKKIVTCSGDSNASIILGANFATGFKRFKMGNGNFQDSARFTNFKSGTYLFTVIDSLGCTNSSSIPFIEPLPITVSNSLGNRIACKGDSSGSIQFVASGGISPYTFKFDTASVFSNNNLFNGLFPGTRFYQVKDNNSCVRNFSITHTEPAIKLTASINAIQPICANTKGIVQINGNGGNTPYSYGVFNTTSGSNSTIGNLNAGTYTFYIKDSNNCQINFQNITINSAPTSGVNLSFTKKNAFCFGSASGEITLSGNGGKRPYQFKIDSLSYTTDSIFQNVYAGLHQLYVRDSSGCVASDTTHISQNASMTLSVSSFNNVTCKGDSNGFIFLLAGGGKAPYSYRIDSGNFQSSPSFSGLKAGIHYLQVKDSNACIKTINYTIQEPNLALSANLLINQPNCNLSKGQAVFTPLGGTPPYTYGIVNGNSSFNSTINNLNPGTYSFYIKDDNNCQVQFPNRTVLNAPPNVSFSLVKKDAYCYGSNTGEIKVSGSGGKSPYTYRVNSGVYQSDSIIRNLYAGKYRVTIKDSVGCLYFDSIQINQNQAIQITVSGSTRIACKGDSSASINVSASNGAGNYLFSLDNSTYQSNQVFSNLKAGLKVISVKDSDNCSHAINYTISEPLIKLSVTASVNQTICDYQKSSITLNTSGGNLPYSFTVNNSTPTSNPQFTNLDQGTYSFVVTDSNGCSINLERNINAPLSSLKTKINSKHINCFGMQNGELTVSASGAPKPYVFKINNGNFSLDSTFKNLAAGTYTITTRDGLGCIVEESKTINQEAKITSTITATGNSCLGAKNGTASIFLRGGKSPFSITWLSNPTQTGSIANNLESGLLRVLIQDSVLCTVYDSVFIPYKPIYQDEKICAVTCDTASFKYRLTWNKTPNKGIASYLIYRESALIGTVPFSDIPEFLDANYPLPTNGIAPSYYIKVLDSCGNSSKLSEETKPILMSASVGGGNINLSWTPYMGSSAVSSYQVYRKLGTGSAMVVYQTSVGNLNYTDTFSGTQNRSYIVEALFSLPCSGAVRILSNPLHVFPSSLNESSLLNNEYVLFPNPASSNISIINKRGLNQVKSIQVTDVSGKIIDNFEYEKAQSEIKLDIQQYANGSYFVILILDNGMKVNLPLQKRL
ncbi:MAG: T9SS type A sorting domain-containing protein [Bacteroidia bacterium]